ncbi:hypothetical protein [Rhizomonospora bruguierae]|uniref:hypothetical protein n=1 Tax=Rhizomonospora bruguierae TaxID=1581705 RepID=UPI001BCC6DF2|nr:hypothetical protein [Micromonospora sp. NBRC 107566]
MTVLTGCDAAGPPEAPPPSTTEAPSPTIAGPVPGQECPTTPQAAPEAHGGGPGTDLWALFFFREGEGPLRRDAEIKVVWRMTGAGDLTMTATGPNGAVTGPAWGPESHGGSTWKRPGDEWGTGWTFPAAGCWTITARRATTGTASLVVRVAP